MFGFRLKYLIMIELMRIDDDIRIVNNKFFLLVLLFVISLVLYFDYFVYSIVIPPLSCFLLLLFD